MKTEKKQLLIFVNGYTKGPKFLGLNCVPGKAYWGKELLKAALKYFENSYIDDSLSFVNGEGSAVSSGESRSKAGMKFAETNLKNFQAITQRQEQISFITHSMGGSFAEGMIRVLRKNGIEIGTVLHLSVADASEIDITTTADIKRIQINVSGDMTLRIKDTINYNSPISGIKNFGLVDWSLERYHKKWLEEQKAKGKWINYWDAHYDTKQYPLIFEWATDLEKVVLVKTTYIRNQREFDEEAFSTPENAELRVYFLRYDELPAQTRFKKIIQESKKYDRDGIYSPRADKFLGANE